jgi:hypothetical protein
MGTRTGAATALGAARLGQRLETRPGDTHKTAPNVTKRVISLICCHSKFSDA